MINPDPTTRAIPPTLLKHFSWGGVRERVIEGFLTACASLSIAVTLGIVFVLLEQTLLPRFGSRYSATIERSNHGEIAISAGELVDRSALSAQRYVLQFTHQTAGKWRLRLEQRTDDEFEEVWADREWVPGEPIVIGGTAFSISGSPQAMDGIVFHPPDLPYFSLVSVREFVLGKDGEMGVLPLICGTLLIAGIAAAIGLPLGITSAIYLSEYATPRMRSIIKPALEILAGVPTVVYGYFALTFVTPYLLKPLCGMFGLAVDVYNALSAGLLVGMMIMPMVCSLSEDALRAVPKSLREAGFALGSSKYDVSAKIVVPAAFSGIVASFLLAISRAIGETMIVAIASGIMPNSSLNPLSAHQTMTGYIVSKSAPEGSTDTSEFKSLFAVALTLFLMTLAMNVISQRIMRRYREVYQ